MNFNLSKQNALTKKDKSHEQKIDKKIKLLCNKINKNPNLYTTSSCSGRITIIKPTNKKIPNAFLFKTHDKITFQELKDNIKSQDTIYFRTEPTAIHIACKELSQAQELLTKARNLGWKKSGIISSNSRYIIELFSTETLITPITNNLPESYLQLLVTEANKKLERTWTKIDKLLESIS